MEREKMIEKTRSMVKKDNRLIEGKYDVTVTEYKLILFFMSFIDEADLEEDGFPIFRIPVRLFIEEIGGKNKENYSFIKESVENLMRRVITFERVNENGKKEFIKYNLISRARYVEGEATVEVQIHKDLLPFYRYLKEKYTKIPLQFVFSLKSKNSIRMYELLKQYESTGYRRDKVETLRFYLGIEKKEYKRFESFERKVLRPATNEISEKTDLIVSYTKLKKGRKVEEIEFSILKKSNITQTSQEMEKASGSEIEKVALEMLEIAKVRQEYRDVIDKLYEFGKRERIKKNEILFILLNSKEDRDLTISKISHAIKNKVVKNPFGLLLTLLEIDIERAKYKDLLNSDIEIEIEFFRKLSEAYELQKEEDLLNVIEAVKELTEKYPEERKFLGMLPFNAIIINKSVFLVPLDRESRTIFDYAKNFEEDLIFVLKKRGYTLYTL